MIKRLLNQLSWMEGIVGERDERNPFGFGSCGSLPASAESHSLSHPPSSLSSHSHSSVFSKVFSRRSSFATFIRQQQTPSCQKSALPGPKLDYRSMVSVDDMPELFVSFDKLIPRPARWCEDPPLYLGLRMGKPINKKIPKSTPVMSYGKKMMPEYWFSVPRESGVVSRGLPSHLLCSPSPSLGGEESSEQDTDSSGNVPAPHPPPLDNLNI